MKVKINGRDCNFFTEGKVTRTLDSIASTFSFKARFNPENDDHKELFKPMQFQKIEIFSSVEKNKLILTGTILSYAFLSDQKNNLVGISGYSKCGILEDVTIPPKHYPLESNGLSLKEVATKLAGYYGIKVITGRNATNVNVKSVKVDEDETETKNKSNVILKNTVASPTDSIRGYLSKLTAQLNILLSHDEYGNIILYKPSDKMKPRYFLNKGNCLTMSSSYNCQGMHSDISCVTQPSDDNAGVTTEDTIQNPLIGLYRPTTKTLSSGDDVDTSNAANTELSNELKNISIKAVMKGLFDDIEPGEIVNIHNHEIYSFAYSRYMVAEVSFSFNESAETTELSLVLPETFTGKIPANILFYYQSHKRHN